MIKFTILLSSVVIWLCINHSFVLLAKNAQPLPKSAQTVLFKELPKAKIIDRKELNKEMLIYLIEEKQPYDTVLMKDFNGDKLIDFALLVKCPDKKGKETEKLVVLLNEKNKTYKYVRLESYPFIMDDVFIRIAVPKRVKEFDSYEVVELKHESIERVYFEKSAGIFYWKDEKFSYVQTED